MTVGLALPLVDKIIRESGKPTEEYTPIYRRNFDSVKPSFIFSQGYLSKGRIVIQGIVVSKTSYAIFH